MAEIKSYPELVDVVWAIVQGTPEERERADFMFSEEQVAKRLGVPWVWESDACVFGIAQAISDLVSLEYCKGIDTHNGHRWRLISPSPYCPDAPPSTHFVTPPIAKLPTFRGRALQFVHDRTLRHEEGITYYDQENRLLVEDIIHTLIPVSGQAEMYSAKGQVFEAMQDLKQRGFISGIIATGAFTLWITLKGSCWLQVGQPLLKLMERANQLTTHPEAKEAVKILIDAYSEAESKAVPMLYIVVEILKNAVGDEKRLAELLGQPKTYIGDLNQSLQLHRHAQTQAQIRLNYQQSLERTTEVIEKYVTQREHPNH